MRRYEFFLKSADAQVTMTGGHVTLEFNLSIQG
jgi:hypothetical protein